MGIEAGTPLRSAKHNVVNEVLNNVVNHQGEVEPSKLSAFMHFPQPVFLINCELEVLEQNIQGSMAIDNRWVGVVGKQLHFNSEKNDHYVRSAIISLTNKNNEIFSERFALRNLDMICRSYTLSTLSASSSEFILTIQSDINCTQYKMESISRAFSLTPSETNIVKMMVVGLKPKEIAYEVGISLNTVRSHLRTLYAKMHARSYNDALTQIIRLLV